MQRKRNGCFFFLEFSGNKYIFKRYYYDQGLGVRGIRMKKNVKDFYFIDKL